MRRRKSFPELEAKERAIRERCREERHPSRPCINCGEKGSHFVGPSFGDAGFFTCEAKS